MKRFAFLLILVVVTSLVYGAWKSEAKAEAPEVTIFTAAGDEQPRRHRRSSDGLEQQQRRCGDAFKGRGWLVERHCHR